MDKGGLCLVPQKCFLGVELRPADVFDLAWLVAFRPLDFISNAQVFSR
jgi:hypothetical protein